MNTKLLTKTLLATAISFAVGTAAAAPYEIIDLGKIEGGTNSFAYGINDAGEVVGYGDGPLGIDADGNSFLDFTSHGIHFSSQGVVDLGELENGTASFALAINNNGVITGYSDEIRTETDDEGNERQVRENFALIFNSGTLTKIPGLESLVSTRAFDINDDGWIVGTGQFDPDPEDNSPGIDRGFVINSNDGSGLGVIPSLTEGSTERISNALAINNSGQIVGWAQQDQNNGFFARGFLTSVNEPEVLVELPNIGTPFTVARDINNNGVIVGLAQSTSNSRNTSSFVYNSVSDSELTVLPFFDDRFDSSSANAVNDSGQIVGQALVSVPSTGINTGYLFENDELKDLNDLIPCNSGWRIDNATNINNNGEIVGYGLRTEVVNGETINEVRAFKLMPTGGAIEICQVDNEEPDNESSGGSWGPMGLFFLMVFGFRRKLIKP